MKKVRTREGGREREREGGFEVRLKAEEGRRRVRGTR
jgi:hypothetical protein